MPADTNLVGEEIRDPRSLVGFDVGCKKRWQRKPYDPSNPRDYELVDTISTRNQTN